MSTHEPRMRTPDVRIEAAGIMAALFLGSSVVADVFEVPDVVGWGGVVVLLLPVGEDPPVLLFPLVFEPELEPELELELELVELESLPV